MVAKKPTKKIVKKPAKAKSAPKSAARKKPAQRNWRKHPNGKFKLIFGRLKRLMPSWKVLSVLILLIVLVVLWVKEIPQYYFYEYTAENGFVVNNIEISGRKYADKEDVQAALNIVQGEPMARFNPVQAHQNLLDVRWVEKAHVQRRWPDSIIVKLRERRPIAIVTSEKRKDYLVDRQGHSLGVVTRQFRNLITLKGRGAENHALTLLAMLESHPTLEEKLKLAERVGDRRWNLYFIGGLEVRLPEENPQKAWDRLAQLARRNPVFDGNLSRIDLRIPDRMVVKRTSKTDTKP